MYKKLLISVLFCIFCISSFGFTTTHESNITLYLGDSLNLRTHLLQESINITIDNETIIQNADKKILNVDNYYNIHTTSVGESLLVIVDGNDLITIHVEVKSPIKSININEQELTLLQGEIYPIEYQLVPHDDYHHSIDQRLNWTSTKNNIVGVKASHLIYTFKVGTTTLIGTTIDGSQSITIDVKVIGNSNGLIIQPKIVNSTINVGETRQMNAFFGTKDITNNVKWESEYSDLITISETGIVTPLREGTCQITAQSSIDRKKDSYTFFIKSMVDKVTLDHSNIELSSIGAQKQLSATLTYAIPDVKPLLDGYYYESTNTSIASVTDDGLVTAIGPGIALISAISYDSGKRDSCTVEVIGDPPSTTIDYIPVRDIKLSIDTDSIVIGQKVALTYDIYPLDATDKTVKFDVKNGNIGQIQFINGRYYFIPDERGTFKIKILANGGVNDISDEAELRVKSPIASLDLDIEIERGSNSEKKLYVGERVEVLTEIYTQGYYNSFDVYPNTLEYTVDDQNVLKLEYLNGKYHVTALERGTTYIRVKNIESRHEKSLRIQVLSPVSKFSTDREVRLPINTHYAPSFNYIRTSASEDAVLNNLYEGIELEVRDFYLATSYIDKEIDYENQVINHFKTLPLTATNKSTITRHETRLMRLILLRESSSKGYALISNHFLMNRNFESYNFFDINDNKIIGYYPGKAKVSINIDGSATNAVTMIYWQTDKSDFAIKSISEWIDFKEIIENEGYDDEFINLTDTEKVQYIIYYLNHKPSYINQPNLNLLKALMELGYNSLPTSFTTNLNAPVTLHELAYISMYLDKEYTSNTELNTNNIIYYDVINEPVKQAIARGYITPLSLDYLGVDKNIDYATFKAMVNHILPLNDLPETFDGPLTHGQLIIFLGNV